MKKITSVRITFSGKFVGNVPFRVKGRHEKELEARNKRIIRGFQRGESISFLSVRYRLTQNRISQILVKGDAKKPKWRKMSDEKKRRIIRKWETAKKLGKKIRQSDLGREFGVSRERVRQILLGI